MNVYVDASTSIALGTVGELDTLCVLDGDLVVPEPVREEVTTEPANENLERFLETPANDSHPETVQTVLAASTRDRAKAVLDEPEANGDVEIVGGVLAHVDSDDPVGVVSDDRRVRTVTDGLGATVTGTIGVVVRTVEDGERTAEAAKQLIRRIDDRGLHMTGELRERAYELVEDAA